MNKITRRNFTRLAAALGVVPYFNVNTAQAQPLMHRSSPSAWPGYEKAIVIDFLASPGPFNTAEPFTALSPEMVENAVASGITAVNLTIGGRTGPAVEDFFRTMSMWEREMQKHSKALMHIRTMADLQEAKRTRRLGLIYGFQDCTIMGDDLSRVEMFSSFGVRIMQLTYNVRNQFADGCLVPDDQGLNPFGHELVAELNKQKVIVDLSHCSTKTTYDGIKASKAPVAISHSGCKAVANFPRSKRDEELKMMADKGGVLGIYLMPFLVSGRAPSDEDVLMHLEHAIKICGEDHVGIGSDLSITPHNVTNAYKKSHAEFVKGRKAKGIAAPGEEEDIFMFVPELNKPNRMELIAEKLLQRGHMEARVEKIVGGNFARLMKEIW